MLSLSLLLGLNPLNFCFATQGPENGTSQSKKGLFSPNLSAKNESSVFRVYVPPTIYLSLELICDQYEVRHT